MSIGEGMSPVAENAYDSTPYTSASATHARPPLLQRIKLALLVVVGRVMARLHGTPQFRGTQLKYVIEPYNLTCANERCLELAIIQSQLPQSGKVLEVGHVWGHYRDHNFHIVDKYELEPGVDNSDFLELPEDRSYDFVFSISTFEHIGWDEEPRTPEKVGAALAKVPKLLAPGGRALITVPVGWNPWLDEQLAAGAIAADSFDWYVRTGLFCAWREATAEETLAQTYGSPHAAANGLVVLGYSA